MKYIKVNASNFNLISVLKIPLNAVCFVNNDIQNLPVGIFGSGRLYQAL